MSYDPVYMRKWRRDHPNYHKEWDTAHPGYRAAQHAAFAVKHPGYFTEAGRRYWDENIVHVLWTSAKHRAKAKGRAFTIVESDISAPLDMMCPLLNVRMEPRSKFAPCLDRKDNTLGYVPGNVWVISKRANAIKHTIPLGLCMPQLLAERARLAAYSPEHPERISQIERP